MVVLGWGAISYERGAPVHPQAAGEARTALDAVREKSKAVSIPHPHPETRNPKPETRDPKPETRNPKPETRNPKPVIQNPEPET